METRNFTAPRRVIGTAGWLSPVELPPERKAAVATGPGQRAADQGVSAGEPERMPASVGLDSVVDWMGRQARPDQRGQIPGELAPLLARLQLSAEAWLDAVLNFGRRFKRAAGRAESLTAEAARLGRHWLHGLSHRRTAFA